MVDESKKPKWLRSYKNRPVLSEPQGLYQKPQLPKWVKPYRYRYTPGPGKRSLRSGATDPKTGSWPWSRSYEPKRHKQVSHKAYTPVPLKPYTPVPLKPYTPKPLKPYTPVPLKPYTPKPLKAYTPVPLKPYTPKPIKAYTPKPLKPYKAKPPKPYTPVPLKAYTPKSLKPYTPKPIKAYTPVPLKPYTPVPMKPYLAKFGAGKKVLDEQELDALKAIRDVGGDSTVRRLSEILEIGVQEAGTLCEILGESDYIDLYRSGRSTLTRRGRGYLEGVAGSPSEH